MLGAEKKEKDAKVAHDKVMAFLNEFQLADKAQLYPSQLSGGQRQRIAIIQQILCSEHYLLMDEPFSGLDIIVEGKATELILKVANMDGLNTVIVVTHDISAAASIADHIWALGREHDAEGNPLPGASIVKTYDLIERGLCWTQMGITRWCSQTWWNSCAKSSRTSTISKSPCGKLLMEALWQLQNAPARKRSQRIEAGL